MYVLPVCLSVFLLHIVMAGLHSSPPNHDHKGTDITSAHIPLGPNI